jgi:GrpB-like predicted nucleotidyltransferase (UPF0157 family)
VARHLAFCAYLRQHDQARQDYEALKRAVYAAHPADIGAYNDGKDAWIKQVEPVALAWWRLHADEPAAPETVVTWALEP